MDLADCKETSCSPLLPPKIKPTRIFFGAAISVYVEDSRVRKLFVLLVRKYVMDVLLFLLFRQVAVGQEHDRLRRYGHIVRALLRAPGICQWHTHAAGIHENLLGHIVRQDADLPPNFHVFGVERASRVRVAGPGNEIRVRAFEGEERQDDQCPDKENAAVLMDPMLRPFVEPGRAGAGKYHERRDHEYGAQSVRDTFVREDHRQGRQRYPAEQQKICKSRAATRRMVRAGMVAAQDGDEAKQRAQPGCDASSRRPRSSTCRPSLRCSGPGPASGSRS